MKMLRNAEAGVIGILILVMSLLAFVQVLTRYVFKYPLPWIEELTRYIMVWMVLIGAATGVASKSHLGVEIMGIFLSPSRLRILNIFTMGLTVILGAVLVVVSTRFSLDQIDTQQLSPAMQIPMAYVTAALAVGSLLITIHAGHQLLTLLNDRLEKSQLGKSRFGKGQ
ncbi:MAG: TRAP transporter small permease [Firmicutes bacterium]|nr:TRAP transporter small permease [Bacillota bacterium]